MPGQQKRKKSVRQKLNAMSAEFNDILIVDDSIVRGTTSKEIVQMAKDAGANKVLHQQRLMFVFHVYGINMPNRDELIAHDRTISEMLVNLKLIILFIKVLKIYANL